MWSWQVELYRGQVKCTLLCLWFPPLLQNHGRRRKSALRTKGPIVCPNPDLEHLSPTGRGRAFGPTQQTDGWEGAVLVAGQGSGRRGKSRAMLCPETHSGICCPLFFARTHVLVCVYNTAFLDKEKFEGAEERRETQS